MLGTPQGLIPLTFRTSLCGKNYGPTFYGENPGLRVVGFTGTKTEEGGVETHRAPQAGETESTRDVRTGRRGRHPNFTSAECESWPFLLLTRISRSEMTPMSPVLPQKQEKSSVP